MPKSHAQAGGVRLGPALYRNIDDVTYGRAAHKQWQVRLELGLVGRSCRPTASLHEASGPNTTEAQLRRHARNELAVCGRIITPHLLDYAD